MSRSRILILITLVVAAAYEERHPGVTVEQIAVPANHYVAWLRTRLTGESMPDLATFGNVPEDEFPRSM